MTPGELPSDSLGVVKIGSGRRQRAGKSTGISDEMAANTVARHIPAQVIAAAAIRRAAWLASFIGMPLGSWPGGFAPSEQ